jgi:hypothetical protein
MYVYSRGGPHTALAPRPSLIYCAYFSELLYDWRFTANRFVFATSPLRLTTRDLLKK